MLLQLRHIYNALYNKRGYILCQQDQITSIKKQKDFQKLHFKPIYDEIKIEFGFVIRGTTNQKICNSFFR